MNLFAILNADLTGLFERVRALETEVGWHIKVAAILFTLLAFFGWKQVRRWIREGIIARAAEYQKQAERGFAVLQTKLEGGLAEMIAKRTNEVAEADQRLANYINIAAKSAEEARIFAENLKLSGRSEIVWEAGENLIEFNNVNYMNFWVKFRCPFLEVPQIFVCECNAGEWVFVKVDEKHEDRFLWAARSLSGLPIRYKTKIQWVAIGRPPAMKEPSKEFEKVEATPSKAPGVSG